MSLVGLKVGGFEVTESTLVPEMGEWYLGVRTEVDSSDSDTPVLLKFLSGSSSAEAVVALSAQYDQLKALDDAHIPAVLGFFEGVGALAVRAPLTASLSGAASRVVAGQLHLSDVVLGAIVEGITKALLHALGRGVRHGQLSVSQVGVSLGGQVIVWGFGLPEPSDGLQDDLTGLATIVGVLMNNHATSGSQKSLLSLIDQRMMDPVAHMTVILEAAVRLSGAEGASSIGTLAETLSAPQQPTLLPFDDGPSEQVETIEREHVATFDETNSVSESTDAERDEPDDGQGPVTSPVLPVMVEETLDNQGPSLPDAPDSPDEDEDEDEDAPTVREVFSPVAPLDADALSFLVVRGLVGALFLTMLLYLGWRLI